MAEKCSDCVLVVLVIVTPSNPRVNFNSNHNLQVMADSATPSRRCVVTLV